MALQVTRMLVPSSKYNIKCPYSMNPEGIVVHNTLNKASAMSEASYMINNNNKVSYHVAVDDYRAVECVPFNRSTWNAGDGINGAGNRKYISIEICYSTGTSAQFAKAEQNAAYYIACKLKEYGWGIERVKKHQDFSGKYCPHKTLDLGWQRFLNMVKANLETAGWQKNDTGWWYKNEDGTYPVSTWKKISEKWYYFDEKGYMKTGWLFVNDQWYYLSSSGAMLENEWLNLNDKWYWLKTNGCMAKNELLKINDKTYAFLADGHMGKTSESGELL